ncbi:MAG: hypothetical protein NT058_01225 [Candidatus Portnoybacteria bacterium]|nr:hypothetical protein [Candidatus Portnoybacteria bacterium]
MAQDFDPASSADKLSQSEPKPKRRKIITVVVFFVIIAAVLYIAGTTGAEWWQEKQMWVDAGFASEKFPFRMFTERELVEKGLWSGESPALNAVVTTIRPEETYAKFRQALIDGNLDKAVECFVEDQQADWKISLYEIKENGFLQGMIDDLPEKLEDTYFYTEDVINKRVQDVDLDKTASTFYVYSLKSDKEVKPEAQTMSFQKNWDGVWLIEDL